MLTLTEDQTRWFQKNTVPTDLTIEKEMVRNPILNPDFCIASTQFGVDTSSFKEFTDFENDFHYQSAMLDYKQEEAKGIAHLNQLQIKARFAYRRGCRFFILQF